MFKGFYVTVGKAFRCSLHSDTELVEEIIQGFDTLSLAHNRANLFLKNQSDIHTAVTVGHRVVVMIKVPTVPSHRVGRRSPTATDLGSVYPLQCPCRGEVCTSLKLSSVVSPGIRLAPMSQREHC